MSNSSEDMAEFREGDATVTITRPHRATPPLNGTFDAEIYGGRAEGSSHGDVSHLHFNNSAPPGCMHFSLITQKVELPVT